MVSLKQAVANTIDFWSLLEEKRVQGVQLEEVESATKPEGPVWLITLSVIDSSFGGLTAAFNSARDYKTFTVNKETGEVIAMKIRELTRP